MDDATPPGANGTGVVRLGRTSLMWRAVILVVGVTLAALGTARWNDDRWPFAPMSQFAFAVGRSSEIRSTHIDALTTEGTVVQVSLSPGGVGLGRAEIEGQLPNIIRDPVLLQDIAVRQRVIHPDQPQFRMLWLRQRVTQLRDGAPVGTHDETLATWTVTP